MRMGHDCRRLRNRLPGFAAGNRDQEVEQHVNECPDCKRVLSQYAAINTAGSLPRFEPPEEVVRRAQALFQPVRRTASLVRSSLASTGARRGQPDAFQCLFEAGGDRVRVAYLRQGAVWVVQGEAPPKFSHVRCGRRKISIEAGKFRFESKTLAQCRFMLIGAREEVEILPPEVGR